MIAGLITNTAVGGNPQVAVVVGIAVAAIGVALCLTYGARQSRKYIARTIEMRIPGTEAVDGEL